MEPYFKFENTDILRLCGLTKTLSHTGSKIFWLSIYDAIGLKGDRDYGDGKGGEEGRPMLPENNLIKDWFHSYVFRILVDDILIRYPSLLLHFTFIYNIYILLFPDRWTV